MSTRAPSLGRGCRAQRGGVGFLLGRRSGALVNGVLETISPLSFIPLEPYPARSARHLPHAGKALSVGIVLPHMHVFALTVREKRYARIVAFPIGEGGPRQRWIGCFR